MSAVGICKQLLKKGCQSGVALSTGTPYSVSESYGGLMNCIQLCFGLPFSLRPSLFLPPPLSPPSLPSLSPLPLSPLLLLPVSCTLLLSPYVWLGIAFLTFLPSIPRSPIVYSCLFVTMGIVRGNSTC